MPIRIVCPSCSAALSVKDEVAGRAVKCLKCGGTIPASQTAAAQPTAAPAPPPVPQKPSFETVDEPSKPSKSGSKVTGQPAARVKDANDKSEDENRPKRKNRDDDGDDRDDDRDERSEKKSKKRDRDDDRDDDDRPSKNRRRDDDDEDRPRGKKGGKKKGEEGAKKGGGGMIVAIICGTLLLCCTGVGGGVWYAMKSAQKGLEEFGESLKEKNDKVTAENFQKLQPLMTRTEVEGILGSGRQAMLWDVNTAFEESQAFKPAQIDEWVQKSSEGRVLVWRNKDDYLFVLFHDKPESGGGLQMKALLTKAGTTETSGTMDDAKFVKDNSLALAKKPNDPPGKGTPPKGKKEPPSGGVVEITAEQLLTEYHKNKNAADKKYRGKTLIVSGPVGSRGFLLSVSNVVQFDITFVDLFPSEAALVVAIVKPALAKGINATLRGQTVRFKGRLDDTSNTKNLIFEDCEVLEVVPVNFITVTADDLFADFARNAKAAEKKYAGRTMSDYKYLHLTNARVTEIEKDKISLTAPTKKGAVLRVTASYLPEDAKSFAKLKVGDQVNVKGQSYGNETHIVIDWATIVP
jgi:predicted Zn finger-like uncharacterized protein